MKRQLLLIGLLAIVTFAQCTLFEQKEKTLNYTGKMKVYCRALGGIIGEIDIVNGKGIYVQKTDEKEIAFVRTELDKRLAHYFILEKGEITVTVTPDTCIIWGGTPGNEAQGELDRKMEPLRLAIYKLQHEDLSSLDSVNRKKKKEEISAKIKELAKEWDGLQKEFALKRTDIVGLNYAKKLLKKFTAEELKIILNGYKSFSDHSIYKTVKFKYEALLRTNIGVVASDFKLPDLKGKMFSLSGFQGKVVLIDFWASWCKPCRKSIPHLKEMYNEFHKKGLEIISISTDKNRDKWEKALGEENMIWLQLVDYKKEASRLYGITSIPKLFLVDEEGKILAKDLRGTELDTFLRDYLAK